MGRLTMHHAHCPAVRERETVIPDPFCHLIPGQALVTKVQDLLGGRR